MFQICTLNETNSVIKKRQEIGRGLRICVDQNGDRHYGHDKNVLTVMANESYEDFAKALQEEIELEEGIKFGVISEREFANIVLESGELFGVENSEIIFKYLLKENYIKDDGKIEDKLKLHVLNGSFRLPDEFMCVKDKVVSKIKVVSSKLNIKNRENRVEVGLNKEVLLGDDFKKLWEKIKYKSRYSVSFNENKLIQRCIENLNNTPTVGKMKLTFTKVKSRISRAGIEEDERKFKHEEFEVEYTLPDIVTYLQNETGLTRRCIVEILQGSNKLKEFKNNPQLFIDRCKKSIKKTMEQFIVDGVKYEKIGNGAFYAQELFAEKELVGYLESVWENKTDKSIYTHTVCDSLVERDFAKSFNESENIKLFAKLPSWFKIDTPLGGYNPDWAVVVNESLYFVVESKGSEFLQDLRNRESGKIECAKRHFEIIANDVNVVHSKGFEDFSNNF